MILCRDMLMMFSRKRQQAEVNVAFSVPSLQQKLNYSR